MSRREQARVQVLNGVLEGRWDVREAAEVMEVSERHGWRVLAAYRKEGIAATTPSSIPAGVFLGWCLGTRGRSLKSPSFSFLRMS